MNFSKNKWAFQRQLAVFWPSGVLTCWCSLLSMVCFTIEFLNSGIKKKRKVLSSQTSLNKKSKRKSEIKSTVDVLFVCDEKTSLTKSVISKKWVLGSTSQFRDKGCCFCLSVCNLKKASSHKERHLTKSVIWKKWVHGSTSQFFSAIRFA